MALHPIPNHDQRRILLIQTLAKQLLFPQSIQEQIHHGLQLMENLRVMVEKTFPLSQQSSTAQSATQTQQGVPSADPTSDPKSDHMTRALAQLSERLGRQGRVPRREGFDSPQVERIETEVKRSYFRKNGDTQPILVPASGKKYELERS